MHKITPCPTGQRCGNLTCLHERQRQPFRWTFFSFCVPRPLCRPFVPSMSDDRLPPRKQELETRPFVMLADPLHHFGIAIGAEHVVSTMEVAMSRPSFRRCDERAHGAGFPVLPCNLVKGRANPPQARLDVQPSDHAPEDELLPRLQVNPRTSPLALVVLQLLRKPHEPIRFCLVEAIRKAWRPFARTVP